MLILGGVLDFLAESGKALESVPDSGGLLDAHFVDLCEASVHVPSINTLLRVRICGACFTELGNLKGVEFSVSARCMALGKEARLFADSEASVHGFSSTLGIGEDELIVEITHLESKILGLLGLGQRRELDVRDGTFLCMLVFGVADGVVVGLFAARRSSLGAPSFARLIFLGSLHIQEVVSSSNTADIFACELCLVLACICCDLSA